MPTVYMCLYQVYRVGIGVDGMRLQEGRVAEVKRGGRGGWEVVP